QDPAAKTLTVKNVGTGTLAWTVTASPGWLSVSPTQGSLTAGQSGPLTVSVHMGSLAAGSYSGSVVVSAPGATGSPQTIPVSLSISPVGVAVISLDKNLMSFSGTVGGTDPAGQALHIQNIGGSATSLDWTANADSSWLTVTPNGGTLGGGQSA